MKNGIKVLVVICAILGASVYAAAPIGSSIQIVADNGRYVSADSTDNILAATKTVPGAYETFDVEDAGGGLIALKCTGNNLYVVAEGAGAQRLAADRVGPPGAWEKFTWVGDTNSFNLISDANGQYVTSDGTDPLIAARTIAGAWETFTTEAPSLLPYQDPNTPLETRVQDLLGRMTLEEKVAQITGEDKLIIGHDGIPGNSRLGIPLYKIAHGPFGFKGWFEVGWNDGGPIEQGTYYPVSIAMAATWDRDMVSEITAALGNEIEAAGYYLNAGPAMNIIRDARCGRSFEYFTEDPYLNGQIATAYTLGLQSEKVGANLKHYVCNNQELNRHSLSATIDDRTLHEIYLPGFKAAIQDGGAWSVMSSYNKINNTFASENHHLLTEVLRGQWNFDGFVLSDYGAVHSTAPSANAGMDVEMAKQRYYGQDLVDAVNASQVQESQIDFLAGNVLRALFRSDAFDKTTTYDRTPMHSPAHIAIAREGSAKSMVLLKNENNTLPFDAQTVNTVAVIGPNGDFGDHFRPEEALTHPAHVQLFTAMDRAGCNKGMDACVLSGFQSQRRTFDVARDGTA
jgi:beta-glucosidase-like glycosyl hydrolase